MTIIAFTPSAHRWTAALCLSMTVALLTGCADSSSKGEDAVATAPAPSVVTASGGPTTDKADKADKTSDVIGRAFDLGTIVKVVQVGGRPVIVFDRWTARGVTDSKVATNGVPMTIHSDARYQNLTSRTTFRIPVVAGAIFSYSHCVGIDQPVQQRSSTLGEFAKLQSPENVVLLTLDDKGQVTKAQNDPAC